MPDVLDLVLVACGRRYGALLTYRSWRAQQRSAAPRIVEARARLRYTVG